MPESIMRRGQDNKIFLSRPTDYSDLTDPTPISSQAPHNYTVTTALARVYDRAKRTEIVTEVAESTDVFSVLSANAFEVGDTLEFYVTNGGRTRNTSTITAIDVSADTITVTTAEGTGAGETIPVGEFVQVQIGSDVTLTENASIPVIDTSTSAVLWGYEGLFSDDDNILRNVDRVRMQAEFVTDSGISFRPVRADMPVMDSTE
jgi:hypothetical protein